MQEPLQCKQKIQQLIADGLFVQSVLLGKQPVLGIFLFGIVNNLKFCYPVSVFNISGAVAECNAGYIIFMRRFESASCAIG